MNGAVTEKSSWNLLVAQLWQTVADEPFEDGPPVYGSTTHDATPSCIHMVL